MQILIVDLIPRHLLDLQMQRCGMNLMSVARCHEDSYGVLQMLSVHRHDVHVHDHSSMSPAMFFLTKWIQRTNGLHGTMWCKEVPRM